MVRVECHIGKMKNRPPVTDEEIRQKRIQVGNLAKAELKRRGIDIDNMSKSDIAKLMKKLPKDKSE
jgi:hypothetical protein